MVKIREVIIVEGRYDKNTLSQVVDAVIIETNGFGIFNNREKQALLRRLAQKRGLIILTDSDGAGFVIRNHMKGWFDPSLVKHAYIPSVKGKERRKSRPGKEGQLGVEGMRPQVLLEALRRAGASFEDGEEKSAAAAITKADLFKTGLSGGIDSGIKRRKLQEKLELPAKLSADALLDVLNAIMSRDEFYELLS